MKMLGAPLLAAVAATLLLVAGALPAPRPPATTPHFHEARLSKLLGKRVEDPNAQEVGTIKDFVLNRASARLEFAIIGSGGLLGLGRRSQAVPASALSSATILRGVVSTTVAKTHWRNYPPFDGNLAGLSDPPSTNEVLHSSRSSGTPPGQRPRLELASKLKGRPVLDRKHRTVGKVSDLLLDLDEQKPVLLLIRTGQFLARPETFAVPLPRFRQGEGDRLLLDVSPQILQQAPWFSDQAWSAAASPGAATIYRVPGSTET